MVSSVPGRYQFRSCLDVGVLERMVPLLNEGPDGTRQAVLFALSNLTHHGGDHARKAIATVTLPAIVDLLDTPDCRPRIAELCIAVLSHTMPAAISKSEHDLNIGQEVKVPVAFRGIDGVRLLSAVSEAMRRTDVDEELISHGLDLLRTLAFFYRKAMLDTSCERPLVAALASPNIHLRLVGFAGIFRLGASATEFEGRVGDPLQILRVTMDMNRYFSPTLMEAMRNQYGGLQGGMIAELKESTLGMGMGINLFDNTQDYRQVGRNLATKVLQKEYSLSPALFSGPGGDSNFSRAVEALRDSKDPADAHLPDILEIKMAMATGHRDKVCTMSTWAIDHFPDVAFFYYTLATWTEDSRLALRTAKKGLACSGLTDYIKRGLLFKSAEAAFEVTTRGPLEIAAPGSPAWREGIAILHCAQEDSKAYIEMTPMDQKNLKTMIYTYLIISVILEGDELYKNPEKLRVRFGLVPSIFS